MKSSNGSSGRTVVKFSCRMAIFFSLSHPDGLHRINSGFERGNKKYAYIQPKGIISNFICRRSHMNTASFSTTKAAVAKWKSYILCTMYL